MFTENAPGTQNTINQTMPQGHLQQFRDNIVKNVRVTSYTIFNRISIGIQVFLTKFGLMSLLNLKLAIHNSLTCKPYSMYETIISDRLVRFQVADNIYLLYNNSDHICKDRESKELSIIQI